jgi:hypothetical protein
MERKTNEEIANELTNLVNNMSFDYKGVAKELCNQHRTLVQNYCRLCVAFLEQLAEQKKLGRFDLRNQDSVDLGEAFMELDERKRYLSHV